jgi:hypothetical protein
VIIDTGPLVAALDADDRHHESCVELLATARRPLRMPGPVLTEVCYLIEREQGPHAEAAFLITLADSDQFELIHPTVTDQRRMAQLVTTYHDLPLGAVDASVIAIAERVGDLDIAALDLAAPKRIVELTATH